MRMHITTPLLYSLPLSQLTNANIYLKMDNMQPVGSFKIRGIGLLCQEAVKEGKTHLVSSSGGNAGCAAAYAAKVLGVRITVFVPKTTKEVYINDMKAYGAKVHITGEVWDETHREAMQFADDNNCAYIPPFDHPLIWQGHASIIHEMLWQMPKPDKIIVAVGGGGLLLGILEGMKNVGWQDIKILAVETIGAASLAESIKQNRLVTLDKITTIATSLGAKTISKTLFDSLADYHIESQVVSDASAINACKRFAEDHRVLVEPACGAALSICYDHAELLEPNEKVAIIVCGGIGI